MKFLRLTRDAKADLANMADYTHDRFGLVQMNSYLDKIYEGLETIRNHPEIGFMTHELSHEFRCFQSQQHRIYYKYNEDRIIVFAVLHEKQLYLLHLKDRKDDFYG